MQSRIKFSAALTAARTASTEARRIKRHRTQLMRMVLNMSEELQRLADNGVDVDDLHIEAAASLRESIRESDRRANWKRLNERKVK